MTKILKNTLQILLLITLTILIIAAPFSKIISKRAIIAASIFWITAAIIEGKRHFLKMLVNRCPFNRYILLLIAALVISIIFSCNTYQSQSIFFNRYIYYLVLFYIGCWLGGSGKNVLYLGFVFFFSSIHLSYGGITDYLYVYRERLIYAYRRIINFTQYIALYFPFNFMVGFFATNKFIRSIGIIAAVGLYPCLILNGSRLAWVGVPIALLIVLFAYRKKRLATISVLILLLVIMILVPLKKRDFITTFQVDTWGDREQLWSTALRIFSHFPISGAGLGMYEKLLYQYGPPGGYSEGKIHLHAHNTYLEFLAETGIIGLLAFLGVLIAFLKTIFQYFRRNLQGAVPIMLLGLTSGIIATLVLAIGSSVITVDLQDSAIFWLILGVITGSTVSPEPKKNL